MDWAAKYQPLRDQYWAGADAFFSRLPAPLFKQGVLLKNNLATFYADTGQFKDILCRPHDPPFLYLHFWLLDDAGLTSTPRRSQLEEQLFLAALFNFAAVYIHESILDAGSNFDQHYLFLERTLTQQADRHLACVLPAASPFWTYHQTFWQEYAGAMLIPTGRRSPALEPSEPGAVPTVSLPEKETALKEVSARLAFAKIPAVAVALKSGWPDATIAQLCAMLDRLNFVLQALRDIAAIRRDLGRRHYTYPIIRTIQIAGIDPYQAAAPEQILGAFVLSGVMDQLGRELLSVLGLCREDAARLDLPSFTTYFDIVKTLVDEVVGLFSLKGRPKNRPVQKSSRPFFMPPAETIPKVIEMAEGYLLADPTFRESWEVQRRGIFNLPEMTGRAFPAGLIAEILCEHGHNLAESVEMVFTTLESTGFRYYDHPHLPPDADDLGLLLRLYRYSPRPDQHRRLLQEKPLRWLEMNVRDSGQIPVWLADNDEANETGEAEGIPVALWGNDCAAVETNLLLGLIDYDWSGYQPLIEGSAASIMARLQNQGLSAAPHYIPLYTLWTIFKLTAQLAAKSIPAALQDSLTSTDRLLLDRLTAEANRRSPTAQDAALLSLICLSGHTQAQSLFNPDWITLICKQQRYDGSWLAEPLYGTPTRGELATWYASNSVTTAFCYHALKCYQASAQSYLNSSRS